MTFSEWFWSITAVKIFLAYFIIFPVESIPLSYIYYWKLNRYNLSQQMKWEGNFSLNGYPVNTRDIYSLFQITYKLILLLYISAFKPNKIRNIISCTSTINWQNKLIFSSPNKFDVTIDKQKFSEENICLYICLHPPIYQFIRFLPKSNSETNSIDYDMQFVLYSISSDYEITL